VSAEPGPRRAALLYGALLAVVALLPVAPGLLLGQSFYFRDLSLQFLPLRRFALEGLARGEVRWWDPYVHEGIPLSLPPIGYPPALLEVLWIDERWISILLALHLPLAALGMAALARELGAARLPAAGAGLVYAMGGFALSTIVFYIYVQALAWAPLAILALRRAAEGGARRVPTAAAVVAMALSTTGVEVVAQTLAVAVVLSLRGRRAAPALRVGGSVLLGAGLAAPVVFVLGDLVRGSAREAGFPAEVTLAQSIHPITFLQTVLGSLHGDLADPTGRWWGQNFFPGGFPYLLSLYLGATAVGLAAAAATAPGPHRRRLALVALLAAVVCLGRWAGGEWALEVLPPLRRLRFPAKAFFTVHLAVALLVAFALDDLQRGLRLRRYALALAAAAAVPLAPALILVSPALERWLLLGFFAPGTPWAERVAHSRFILGDGAAGAAVALAAMALCLLARRGRPEPRALAGIVCALLAADLLRTGAGINPTVTASFFRLSPEMRSEADRLKAEDRRVFTCDIETSPAYMEARARLGRRHEAWSFAILRETFTPFFSLGPGVRSGLTRDLTMLVPEQRVLSPDEAACGDLARIVPRLREGAVAEVLSVDPLEHPELRPAAVLRPAAIAPLAIHRYELAGALPRIAVPEVPGAVLHVRERPGWMEVRTEVPHEALLWVRDSRDPGWSATRNGRPAAWEPSPRHLAVRLQPGANQVELRYRPPSLGRGLACAAAALAVMVGLAVRGRRRGP
jgi:hypothetical protein